MDVMECIFNADRLPKDKVEQRYIEFYHGLQKYVPKYYDHKLIDSKKHRFQVRLENLLNIWKPINQQDNNHEKQLAQSL